MRGLGPGAWGVRRGALGLRPGAWGWGLGLPGRGARLSGLVIAVLLTTRCAGGAAEPVAIELGRDACSHCRMAILSTRTAGQIVAPGEEARLFDDLGCLRAFVAATPPPADARVFVADHRTGQWVDARQAVFTSSSLATPMGSGLVAHADAASRAQDSVANGGTLIPAGSIVP